MQNTRRALIRSHQPGPQKVGLGRTETKSIFLTLAGIQLVLTQFIHGQVIDFFGPIGEGLRIVIIFGIILISLATAAICITKKLFSYAAFSIVGVLGIFYYTFLYSLNTNIPFTLSAGGEYFGYSMLAVIGITVYDRTFNRLIEFFFVICCCYATFYIVASIAIQFGIIDLGGATRVFRGADDAGRNDRIVISSIAIIFGLSYAATKILRDFKIRYVFIFGIFSVALLISSSRLITALAGGIILSYFLIRNAKMIAHFIFGAFAVGTIFSIYLIFHPEQNPYYLTSDMSGQVRIWSLFIASDQMQYYWILGAGIAFGPDGYFALTGSKFFFPNDIGMIGILFSYGLLGMTLYVTLAYIASRIYSYAQAYGLSTQKSDALALTAAVFTIYSLQTPHFDSSSPAAILAMMALALLLDKKGKHIASRR